MASQTTVLKVAMSCQGCVGAVKRVLGKLEGVEYDIDFDAQKVTVKSNLPPETVLQTVAKTGKKLPIGKQKHQQSPQQSLQKLWLLLSLGLCNVEVVI